jgi:hypothetical protein
MLDDEYKDADLSDWRSHFKSRVRAWLQTGNGRSAVDPTRSAGLAREHFLLGKNEVCVLNRNPEIRLEFTNISGFSGSSKANLQNEAKE